MKTQKRKTIWNFGFRSVAFCFLLITMSKYLQGATYYVSTSGNNANDGVDTATAWRTIAYACSKITAGDTALIKSGDYGNENAVIANSGTASSPIVIKVEIPGSVVLTGTGNGDGIFMQNKSYITIEGIKFSNYSSGVVVKYASSYITVKKCIFAENNNYGILLYGNINRPSDSHHHVFIENQFYDHTDQQDYGIALYFSCDTTANNNYFFGKHHQALSFKKQMYNSVAANNVFEGFLYSALYLGQNLNDSEGDLQCFNLIAEGNTFRPASGYRAKTPIWAANVTGAVVRNNFMEGKSDVDGGWGQGIALGDMYVDNGVTYEAITKDIRIYNNIFRSIGGTTTNPGIRFLWDCKNVKVFNNTFVNCAYALGFEVPAAAFFKNNIFYNNGGIIRTSDSSDARNSTFEHNNFYPDWSGKGTTDISVDPKFVGPFTPIVLTSEKPSFNPDYSRAVVCKLQSDSLCLDQGSFLTKAIGSGSGNKITVEDPTYFIDGFGRVSGDSIQVGANQPVRITGIDYQSKILTIEQNIFWNSGDGISLSYAGSSPDIGAYEYGFSTAVAPPAITSFSPANISPSHDEGTTNTFSVTVDQLVTNKWYLDNVQQAETSQVFSKAWSYTDTGIHTISYTGTNINGSVLQSWTVTVNDVVQDSSQTSKQKINVYPNPYVKGKSSGERITFANLPLVATIKIYNTSGKLVKELISESKNRAEWDIGDVGSGMYLYVISSAEGIEKGKVSVVK